MRVKVPTVAAIAMFSEDIDAFLENILDSFVDALVGDFVIRRRDFSRVGI